MPSGSGKRNDFAELFRPEVGETKDQVIGRMEVLLAEVKKWAKKGYEHAAETCTNPTKVDGEMRGGWISPKTWTCSACGFYVGNIKEDVMQLEKGLQMLRDKPDTWRYGLGSTPKGKPS